ncbi:Uncharacterised protein [Chlamydia abortus]|nr:Uncharacterised protein [Chlamydia abortus]
MNVKIIVKTKREIKRVETDTLIIFLVLPPSAEPRSIWVSAELKTFIFDPKIV